MVVPIPLAEDGEDHLSAAAPPLTAMRRPGTTRPIRVLWPRLIGVIGFHLLLPLAFVPWLFSWTGLWLIPIGNYVFCSLGIGAGYHRLLTHRSYRCPRWLEHVLVVLGVCTLQDSPARWVMAHRRHHQWAEREDDPHSPLAGFLWGHMGWLVLENRFLTRMDSYERYVRDVLRDPFYLRFERGLLPLWVYAGHATAFFLAGVVIGWHGTGRVMGGVQFGLSLVVWGVIIRTIYCWHITWGVNSLAHVWGYRNFGTDENSRNNWVIALATNGEGWHNNHHADPRSALHGWYRWWELDVTYMTLRVLAAIGLVWDLVPRRVPGR